MIRDYILDFGIAMPSRYFKFQKANYIDALLKEFKKLGYKYELKAFKDVKNIEVGDVDNAKIIFMTAYDTPSKVNVPNYIYYPFSAEQNIKQEQRNLLFTSVMVVGCVLVLMILYYASILFINIPEMLKLLIVVLGIAIIFYLLLPMPNKANINRHSVSVALMLDIATKVQKDQVAFVFLDKQSINFRGLNTYIKQSKYSFNDKLVVYLDCLADGETTVFAHSVNIDKKFLDSLKCNELNFVLKQFSDNYLNKIGFNGINKIIDVCSGKIENHEFIVKNTRTKQDVHLKMDRISKIEEVLLEMVGKYL
ncbi:MAG: hypothetical protein MR210_07430 [Erysipelotrichaceae bacterium]|nr:hypothetical protein [Erysipelotrichaceae bacterium]MDY5252373.1 hypothetical protein [Erysipelotrichaceae bacterium]